MGWVVKKFNGKYGVFKAGEATPVEGGVHANRDDAIRQMRALYANSKEFSEFAVNTDTLCMLRPLRFSESEVIDGRLTKWIQAIPFGKWDHPVYGMSYFDKWQAENMARNFAEGVHGTPTLHTDFEHGLDPAKGTKASGTILALEVRTDGLWQHVQFTEEATKEILAGEWNYYSPEYFDAWENPMDGTIHSDVLRGGAITNKPWIKGMVPLNFSEVAVVKSGIDEMEHHDPGEEPDYPNKPQDDKTGGASTGSRIDTPPDIQVTTEDSMNEEVLKALGLPADATQEQISAAVIAMATEVAPLREAAAAAAESKQFSEMYPAEAAELKRLREQSIEFEAKQFSDRFRRFNVTEKREGDEDVTVVKGFSALVCDKLVELHKRFSDGSATAEHLGEVLTLIAGDAGVVEYTETGSGLDTTSEDDAVSPTEAARKLSEVALKLQEDAGGADKLSWGDAIAQAAKANPTLARAYSEGTVRKEDK